MLLQDLVWSKPRCFEFLLSFVLYKYPFAHLQRVRLDFLVPNVALSNGSFEQMFIDSLLHGRNKIEAGLHFFLQDFCVQKLYQVLVGWESRIDPIH